MSQFCVKNQKGSRFRWAGSDRLMMVWFRRPHICFVPHSASDLFFFRQPDLSRVCLLRSTHFWLLVTWPVAICHHLPLSSELLTKKGGFNRSLIQRISTRFHPANMEVSIKILLPIFLAISFPSITAQVGPETVFFVDGKAWTSHLKDEFRHMSIHPGWWLVHQGVRRTLERPNIFLLLQPTPDHDKRKRPPEEHPKI